LKVDESANSVNDKSCAVNDENDGPGRAGDSSTFLVPVVNGVWMSRDVTLKDCLTTSRLRYATVWQTDLRRNYTWHTTTMTTTFRRNSVILLS